MKQLLNTLFVTSEDAYLSLENDNVVVQRDKTVLAKIPLRSLEQILSFSYKGASPALMGQCAQTGTGLSFYTPRGRYLCSILGENNEHVCRGSRLMKIPQECSALLGYCLKQTDL